MESVEIALRKKFRESGDAMGGMFHVEGKFFSVAGRMVDLVAITLLWLVGCIPVVTILTSTASMYHTTVKCIRYERGTVFATFLEAYRKNLKQGIALTVFYGSLGALIGLGDYYVFVLSASRSSSAFVFAVGMTIITFFYGMNVLWLACVFSRFSLSLKGIMQLNFVISTRHLLKSIFLLIAITLPVALVLASLPLITIAPALVMLLCSYLTEPCLRRYMPKQEEDNGDWRYGFV